MKKKVKKYVMNARFLPGKDKEVKQGLDTVRKLVPVENAQENNAKVRESIPSNWIYNEKLTQNMWDDLEQYKKKNLQSAYAEQNPFKMIDDSASKIRQIIGTFESQDEEFILNFINILGESEDFAGANFDSDAIFFEARSRLQAMIEQHVDFTQRQSKLLESMVLWYKLQKNMKIDDADQLTTEEMKKYDIKRLQDALDELNRMKESRAEEATSIHHDIVSSMRNKVNEYQTQLTQKELQLNQLQQESSRIKNKRRTSRNAARALGMDEEFQDQQRKILELNTQVTKLKQALMEVTQNSKPVEEATEILNKIPDPLQTEPPEVDLSVQKEIEFENRIKNLNEQIKSIKEDYKNARDQFMKSKQNEMLLEKKLDAAERQKKSLEMQQNTLQKKIEQLESSFNERLEAEKKSTEKIVQNDDSAELIRKYESKIQAMNDNNQKMIKNIEDNYNNKLKIQMQAITNAMNNGDAKSAFEETTRSLTIQLESAKVEAEKTVRDMRQKTSEQLMTMSKHYENILRKKQYENDTIRNSVDSQVRNKMFEIKLEYEEKINQRILEEQGKYQSEITELKNGLLQQIEVLQNKLTDVTHERDAFKSILVESDLLQNEEEDEDDSKKKTDDDILQSSLMALKEREIEQRVNEKYQILLKQQQELLMDSKKWELEQAKVDLQSQFDNYLSDFRSKLAEQVHKIYDESPHDNPALEQLLISVLAQVDVDKKMETQTKIAEPTIPVHEVERKMNELTQKLVELSSQNEVYKKLIDKAGGNTITKESLQEVENAMKEQAAKMGDLARENLELQKEIAVLSAKATANVSRASSFRDLQAARRSQYDEKGTQTLDYRPNTPVKTEDMPIAMKSLEITTSQLFNISSNDSHSMHAECVHCKGMFGFEPSDVQHKLAMSSIITCPICRKLMTLSDDFDDSNNLTNLLLDDSNPQFHTELIEETNERPEITISEANNFSRLQSQKDIKVELQIDLSAENQRAEQSARSTNSNANSRRSSYVDIPETPKTTTPRKSSIADSPLQSAPITQNNNQNTTTIENIQNASNNQQQNVDVKVQDPQLAKLVENNSILQKKLILAAQALKDMEKQYNEYVSHMEVKISDMQHEFIRQNQIAISASKELPPTKEGEIQKIETVSKIYKSVREVQLVSQFDIEALPTPPPANQEQMIEITENALDVMKIHNENRQKTVKVKADFVTVQKKISGISLEIAGIRAQLKQLVKRTNEKNKEFLVTLKKAFENYKLHSSKNLEDMKKEVKKLNSIIEDKNKTIKDREKFMSGLRDELDNTRGENDKLRDEIQSSLTEVQRLQLKTGEKSEIFKIMKATEVEREKHIDSLTDDVVTAKKELNKAQNDLQHVENENVQLKDQIIMEEPNENVSLKDKASVKSIQEQDNEKENENEDFINRKMEFVPCFTVFKSNTKMSSGFALVSRTEMKNKKLFSSSPQLVHDDEISQATAKIQTPKNTVIKVITKPNSSIRVTTAKTSIRKGFFPRPITPNIHNTKEDDVVNFDLLVPLTVDDTSSSVIAYVTHYVKQRNPGQSPITDKKPLLLPTPAESSEVKTAVQSSRSSETKSVKSVKSTSKFETPPKEGTVIVNSPLPASKSSRIEREQNLEKRIKQLERIITDKTNEIVQANDKIHELNVYVFRIKQEIIKAVRNKHKSDMMLDASKKQVSKAMEHIVERDHRISELKKVITDFRKIADNLKHEHELNKRDSRSKSARLPFTAEYDDVVLNKYVGFGNMIDNEMRSLERWNLKRKNILDKERAKLIATLRASSLLDETPIKQDLIRVTSSRSPEKKTTVTPDAKRLIK